MRSVLKIVGRRYELQRQLDRGAIADTYLGCDLLLERDVIVKVLREELLADARVVDRFRRGARGLASVRSPHIVPLHDARCEPDEMFLVLRYVSGRTLEDVRSMEGPLPHARATHLVTQVLDGMASLHAARLAHRDVGLGNVLVDWNDHAVLTGLALEPQATDAPSSLRRTRDLLLYLLTCVDRREAIAC